MKKRQKQFWKRLSAGLLTVAVVASTVPWWNGDNTVEAASNATLTVDMTAEDHEIVHGAAGFLYGVSSEDVPTTNTMTPLKPKILATKGALGTEHPYGDALDVAKTFLESGGEQVQMYNSNYYGVFGVLADYKEYSEVLETIITPAVVEWKEAWNEEHGTPENPKDNIGARIDIDKAIVYIPINEGTPVVGGTEAALALGYEDKGGWVGNIGRNEGYFIPWQSYYEAINRGDPNATIAGPNCWGYNGPVEYRPFIKWCYDNDCLPDIATWHELSQESLRDMSTHIADFKTIWKEEVTDKGGPELPQIVINEYAQMIDCGVPGRLVNWMARLEDEGIYGCLPFWHQANNLNDLTADANEGNGAWWLYKWYGDMSGNTLEVESSTSYEQLYGLATLDDNKQMATVLFGGLDGGADVILENVADTETFKGADKVNISIEATYFIGFHGALNEPAKILEGTYPVNADGSVTINMKDMKFSDAYRVIITKASGDSQITDPLVNTYHKAYEAEDSSFSNGAASTAWHGLPGSYYFSGDYAVSMSKGAILTYTIEVPVAGKYRMDFVYANGMGANAQNMDSHSPYNINQSLSIDGGATETVEFKNTLMPAMTGLYTQYADLTAGSHTFTFTTMDAGTVYHDVAYVTYSGAINEDVKRFDGTYEAEQADFNQFTVLDTDSTAKQASTKISTETELSGYSGNGYVTGLSDQLVTAGGGVRWNVIVENSGLYNISLRYQSSKSGQANIYVGNTTATLDRLVKSILVTDTGSQWKTVTGTVYLQKGINIVDVDATADIALDYMRVQKVPDEYLNGEAIAKNTVIEAEDAKNAEDVIVVDCDSASNNQYVEGLKGSATASDNPGQYLEFDFDAVEAGIYQMQVFQSNDSICGTHMYNIKIIDKYAIFEIRNEKGEITSTNRYFFINTFSAQSFREKTIPMEFSTGKNTIRVYNDDSWNVLWGGTQSTPGDNEMENYTPNFDKFVINATALQNAVVMPEEYGISIKTTAAGYAATDENYVEQGGTFHLSMVAEKGVEKILVDGVDKATDVIDNGDGTYSLDITDVQDDVKVVIYFTEGSGEHIDQYIVNAGFGSGTTYGWITAETVQKEAANEYEGNFLKLSAGGNLKQEVTGVPEGAYWLYVYAKADSTASISGTAVLKANGEEATIEAYGEYTEISVPVTVGPDGILNIEVDASALTSGALCLDNFSLQYGGNNLLYFVDAGDHDPTTLSNGDRFGQYNSVTDQIYGIDSVSENKWGLLTFNTDPKINTPNTASKAVYTEYQRANLNDGASDGLDKTVSFRYAHGQDGAGISQRYVKYAFTLPAGTYKIEAGVGNTWGNSADPALYTGVGINSSNTDNGNLTLLEDIQKSKTLSGTVTVEADTEEFIVAILSSDATINLNYIKISVVEPTLEEIVIEELPDKVEYNTGESLDLDGLKVVAQYDDGSEKVLSESSFSISGFNSDRATTRTLTVTYTENGVTVTETFTVDILDLLYFVDAGDTTPTTVNDGDSFGKYNSDITDQIYDKDASGYKWGVVTTNDDTDIGYQNTTYQRINGDLGGTDKNTYFRYADGQDGAHIDPRYVKYAFTLPAGTYKIEAGVGNLWDNSGNPELHTGTGIQVDNTEHGNLTLLDSLDTITPYGGNSTLSGTITVDDYTEEFIVAILSEDATINLNYITITAIDSEPLVEKLVIDQLPNKIRYANGESFDMEGLSVTAHYDDGTTSEVELTEDMLIGFDPGTAGRQTITVTYGEKTATFKVTVDAAVTDELITVGVNKSQYIVGEEFDETTVVVNVVKSNGSVETVTTGYTVDSSEFVKDIVGAYPIYVTYNNNKETIYVEVIDTLGFSYITSAVSNKKYAVGEAFDLDSVVITAVYSNATGRIQRRVLDASEYNINDDAYDAEIPGIYKIIVTYEEDGKQSTISFNVRVVDDEENLTLMYFVDAGDHDPTTINKGEEYGQNNSVTDQLFGLDPGTEKYWGVLDGLDLDGTRLINSGWKPNPLSKAVYTQYTRAYSNSNYDCTDGLDKTHSFRYASGQDTSSEVKEKYDEIYVDYKFELESGKQYKVELFVSNPWGIAWDWPDGDPVTVSTNKGDVTEQKLAEVCEDADRYVTGYVSTDKDGYLTVNVRRPYEEGRTVMVNYIKIYEYDVRLESISVNEMPAKTTYAYGEELELDGMKVAVRYSDGTEKVLDIDDLDYKVAGYEATKAGNQTITVSYTETYGDEIITRRARFDVTVEEEEEPVVMEYITVTAPNKTVYKIGDEFIAEGMVVKAFYSNGTEKLLLDTEYSYSGFNTSKAGTVIVTISYEEDGIAKTAEFQVEVEEVVLTAITAKPLKAQFELDEELDLDGLVVKAFYDNNTERRLADTEYEVDDSDYNATIVGTYVIKVFYMENGIEKETEFEIQVVETITEPDVLDELAITLPYKTEYEIGEELDLTGMFVMAKYTNSRQKKLNAGDYTVSVFDSSKAGTVVVTVSYEEDGIIRTAEFEVTIKEKAAEPVVMESITVTAPNKTDYEIGDEFNVEGMVVKAVYSNGTEKKLSTADYNVSGFDSSKAGTIVIVVSYEEEGTTKTAEFSVTIKEKDISNEVDKTKLQNLYNSYKDKANDNYTDSSWNALQVALTDVETVLNNENATQQEIDVALEALQTAVAGLTPAKDEEPKPDVDKSELQNLYDSYKDKVQGNYTDASWKVLQSALKDAKAILADENATQSDVDEALTVLEQAVKGLETVKIQDNKSKGSGSKSGKSTTKSPSTGDNNMLSVLLILMLISLATVGYIYKKSRVVK